ncbi:N-acetylmuramoyl-L-alanine amidase [Synechococcales cyanobacterium C]|uniref:N-acetylmuramoyl-L-alanine amidase n=1 Tax=Petrachloros mirabilis ULC683 TaxID=2781853 RepID=A0A8K2A128_9CYAN|nr:peptidoglycan recognition family protein [Petrachloros mirabilis]NCJ08538.1 N-acetylmuramoyl-L-alanine amidase [Petrachloros mirabilis ULC683]
MLKRPYRPLLLFLLCILASLITAAYSIRPLPTPVPPTPIPSVRDRHATLLPNLEDTAEQSIPKHQVDLSEIPSKRQPSQTAETPSQFETPRVLGAMPVPQNQPVQVRASIDSTNYGNRFTHDQQGHPLRHQPIIVLHETVYSAMSAINYFRTPHLNDKAQASYHALIALDGMIIYLVPAQQRAYGAGNSVFESDQGRETVQTNPRLPPSVNNFAYHIALETPPDGENQNLTHSGYTPAQYQSLAWLVARTRIPNHRITTHAAIDQGGERIDPRSFDFDSFLSLLAQHRLAMEPDLSRPS